MQIASLKHNIPLPENDTSIASPFEDAVIDSRLAFVGQENATCKSVAELSVGSANDPANCFLLNAAEAHFDGGIVRLGRNGTFFFLSSRNNYFGWREQKLAIAVGYDDDDDDVPLADDHYPRVRLDAERFRDMVAAVQRWEAPPTPTPTTEPTPSPTTEPSPSPTTEPSPSPTAEPSPSPTAAPSSTTSATTSSALSSASSLVVDPASVVSTVSIISFIVAKNFM